jgi:pimeloyl-ACP methyl ester carboxylesterase
VPVRTAADLAADQRALLAALGVSPPYVLVGHSWGGVDRPHRRAGSPADVVGLVLVDATHESIDSRGFALLPLMYGSDGAGQALCRRSPLLLGIALSVQRAARLPGVASSSGCTTRRCGASRCARPSPKAPASGRRWLRSAGTVQTCRAFRCTSSPPAASPVANVKQIQRVHEAWKAMVGRAARAQYTNIPSSGHQMPVEVPELVADAIAGVLDACSPAHALRDSPASIA